MSPTPMSPVDYQPTPSISPSTSAAGGLRHDPKRSQRDRAVLLGAVAAGFGVLWTALNAIIPEEIMTPLLPLGIGVLLSGGWTLHVFLTSQEEPFFARLALTGAGLASVWAVGTALLMLLGVHPLVSGLLLAAGLWFFSLALPIWVIEIEPGEVLYFRPLYHRPYKYELVSCPVQRIEPELKSTERDTRRGIRRIMDTPTHRGSQVELAMDWLWIRPLDELRLLWKLEKNIVIEKAISNIVTRDHSVFSLWIHLVANFDPTQIKGQKFLLMMPKVDSPARMEHIIKGIIEENLDRAAREYFIQRTVIEARGDEGVRVFRSQLLDLLKSLHDNLGLTFIESQTNTTPIVSEEQRLAAERAAASHEQARADLATTDALIERAMSGSAPHQLLLYTRLLERGAQFHVIPPAEQMPQLNPVDQFLWRMARHDAPAVQLFQQMASSYPEMPLPESLRGYLNPGPQPALPPPAPAQHQPADSPPPPPDTLPESGTRPSAASPRPMPDIRRALRTRQRPDGTYEVDFEDNEKE